MSVDILHTYLFENSISKSNIFILHLCCTTCWTTVDQGNVPHCNLTHTSLYLLGMIISIHTKLLSNTMVNNYIVIKYIIITHIFAFVRGPRDLFVVVIIALVRINASHIENEMNITKLLMWDSWFSFHH